jgi:hypothetical protein
MVADEDSKQRMIGAPRGCTNAGLWIERNTDVSVDQPKSQLVYTFPGNWCGVPTVVGHYLGQTVPAEHALIVLDISNGAKPVEVSRLEDQRNV